jgi:predicted Rossmann fold nucleotide-binding protein DprA/Smf involved in DNA uptake
MAKGPNHLIKNGASLVETAEDIINCFPPGTQVSKGFTTGEREYGPPAALKALSPDAGDAYSAIAGSEVGLSADELAEKLAWPVQRTAASLFELEVFALVGTNTGRYVVK